MVRMFTPAHAKPASNKMVQPNKDNKQVTATEKEAAPAASEAKVKRSLRRESRLALDKKAAETNNTEDSSDK